MYKLNAVDPQAYLTNALAAIVDGHRQSQITNSCRGIIRCDVASHADDRGRSKRSSDTLRKLWPLQVEFASLHRDDKKTETERKSYQCQPNANTLWEFVDRLIAEHIGSHQGYHNCDDAH